MELRVTRFDCVVADNLSFAEMVATFVTFSVTILRAAFVRGAIGLLIVVGAVTVAMVDVIVDGIGGGGAFPS